MTKFDKKFIKFFTRTDVYTVDFNTKETVDSINHWCEEVTKNHIKKIVTQNDIDKAVILLINAIFFNGYWRKPFPVNETESQTFHMDTESQVLVPFMKQTENFYYLESEELDAKILRLQYKVS